jgi:toxin ParE1/3/4
VARIVVTSTADADAAHIFKTLAEKAGKIVAIRYDAHFDRVYDRLATHPGSGASRSRLGPRIRICVVWPYVVIYDYLESEDVVTIMRVIDGRRKITRSTLLVGD